MEQGAGGWVNECLERVGFVRCSGKSGFCLQWLIEGKAKGTLLAKQRGEKNVFF